MLKLTCRLRSDAKDLADLRDVRAPRRRTLSICCRSVGIVCGLNEVRHFLLESWADVRWDGDTHFRDVDPKRRVESRSELERRAPELGVLINASHSGPAACLDKPISSVDVDALLSVPTARPPSALECLWAREGVLRREYERSPSDALGASCLIPHPHRDGRKLDGVRFVPAEGVPWRDWFPIDEDAEASLDEPVEDHPEMLVKVAGKPTEATNRPSRVVRHSFKNSIEAIDNDGCPRAFAESGGELTAERPRRENSDNPSVELLDLVEVEPHGGPAVID